MPMAISIARARSFPATDIAGPSTQPRPERSSQAASVIVVLRRLEDAIDDHDTIHAVILGSAVNNDGQRKVGYLAPSVAGQAEVIAEALGVAA